MRKGQYIRLFLSTSDNPDTPIAAAKEMSLHLGTSLEDSTTKDSTGDWVEQEVVGQNYDISFSALVLTDDDTLGGNTAITLNDMLDGVTDSVLHWQINVVDGTNNRNIVKPLFSGTAKLTSLQIAAQVKQNATYNGTLTGYGDIAVLQDSSSEL